MLRKEYGVKNCIINTISLPKEKWKQIDKDRGYTSRSKFLLKILDEEYFSKNKVMN